MRKIKKFFFNILFLLISFDLHSEILKDKELVLERINELGKFENPEKFPKGMSDILYSGCSGFTCAADKATQEMAKSFKRKGLYLERNPGTQLYAMAMFEMFYQKQLKENEDKIQEFIETIDDKRKNSDKVVSLLRLNDSRKKMRAALGMTLENKTEEVIENFWIMGDFVEAGNIKKQNVSKDLKKRKDILNDYQKAINTFKTEIKRKEDEEFYEQIEGQKLSLIDKFKDNSIEKKFENFINDYKKARQDKARLAPSNQQEAKNIDKSINEIDKIVTFIEQNFNTEDLETASKILEYANKNISNISKLVPQNFSNDLSKVNMEKLGEGVEEKIKEISINSKNQKNKNLANLIEDMSELNGKGLDVFQINRNLKNSEVKTLSYQEISNIITDKKLDEVNQNNFKEKLEEKKINYTKNLMGKLGYNEAETQIEINIVQSLELNNQNNQEILISRRMLLSGASDAEINEEINTWNEMRVSSFNDEAYFTALTMLASGFQTKNIQKRAEMVNAVETMREVNKLLAQVENKIQKDEIAKNINDQILDKDKEDETLVVAQAGQGAYTEEFTSKTDELFYSQFLPAGTNKNVVEIAQKAERTYRQYSLPLNIISVVIAPNPYNVFKLTQNIVQLANEKNSKVLAVATLGTDKISDDDYVDPAVFTRTAQVLQNIQKDRIQSKNLSKEFSYSIVLIAANVQEPDQRQDQGNSGEETKSVCVGENCFTRPVNRNVQQKNSLAPLNSVISRASFVNQTDMIGKIDQLLNDRSIKPTVVAYQVNTFNEIITATEMAERLGISDAAAKVSAAFAAEGLTKDGLPSLDAMMDQNFDVSAHISAMETLASEAGLHADIASATQSAADLQDAINAIGGGPVPEDLAQANAEAQQALADAQKALDESRADPNAAPSEPDRAPNPDP